MASVDEVLNRAANDLGVLRLGQALKAQDKKRLQAGYDEVYAMIKEKGVATWPSVGPVPNAAVPYVAALVADNALGVYAVSDKRYQRIKAESLLAMSNLREVVKPEYVSTNDPVDY